MGLTNPFLAGGGLKETEIIGINLEEIMSTPGSKYDLILEEGDVISIPKQLQTVRLRGRVLYPTTVRYENGKSVKYFIDRAGGFDSRARKCRTYVVYANGEVARTKGFLFIRNYPNVDPGAEIIIPVKPLKIPLKPGDLIGVATGLATIALVVSQITFK
jgi:protein involved in polysaccharide export with SLBB domain